MLNKLWVYEGVHEYRTPENLEDIMTKVNEGVIVQFVLVSQEQMDYLAGLQLMYGVALNMIPCHKLHDQFWEWCVNRRSKGQLDNTIQNFLGGALTVTPIPNLLEYLSDNLGDVRFAKEHPWERITYSPRSAREGIRFTL